jgi:hypothetical protein
MRNDTKLYMYAIQWGSIWYQRKQKKEKGERSASSRHQLNSNS